MSDAYGESDRTDEAVRCWRCNKLLAEYATQPWQIKCSRCKGMNRKGEYQLAEESG